MKTKGSKRLFLLMLLVFLTFSLTACGTSAVTPNSKSYAESNSKKNGDVESEKMISVKITVGNKVFTAKLYNNETTQALLLKLPMNINMTELNGKEKYYHLSENLPAQTTERPATIHAGEIMCWSSNSLVLFYNTHSNSYGGYVKLGYIEDISGLKESLGKENVEVRFEIKN